MTGKTLFLYLAGHFLRNVVLVFLLFFSLVVAVDMIELSRNLGNYPSVSLLDVAAIALMRAPLFAVEVLPFAVLFGAMTSLLVLNRRLELVVARAAGVSAWQFLTPLLCTAALLGIFASTVYNPLALQAKTYGSALEAAAFGRVKGALSNKTEKFWQRLPSRSGDTIIEAETARASGTLLDGVTAFRFDENGVATERYDAKSARFVAGEGENNAYVLTDASITRPGAGSVASADVTVPVRLSREQLQSRILGATDVPYWRLRENAVRAETAGKNALPFKTQWQALNAQPLTFVAMVLIASTMSLQFARFGLNWTGIAVGLACGFVLYVVTKLVLTFGSNGLVAPWIAAWFPGLVASLVGVTVILNREDG